MSSRMGGSIMPWWIALPIVAFLDLLDLGFIEMAAWMGEALDVLAIGINFLAVGPLALVGVIEFASVIPALPPIEIFPIHTIVLLIGLMLKS